MTAAVTTADFPPREDRKPARLTGWLTRRDSDTAYDFEITNLSYGGCRLTSDAPLARGDQLVLHVLRRGSIPATVRWHSAHGIGLSFAIDHSRVEIPRKVERLPLSAELVVRRAGRRSQLLALSDLSRFGCRLHLAEPADADDWLWIALPGLSPVTARVRWVNDQHAGIEFVRPIHEAVFDLLLLRWGIVAS